LARPHPVFCRIVLACEFILILRAANYKRRPPSTARFSFDRLTSVAAMQELMWISQKNCRVRPIRSSFDRASQQAAGSGFKRMRVSNTIKRVLTVSIATQHAV
jgi:hypothetical protein